MKFLIVILFVINVASSFVIHMPYERHNSLRHYPGIEKKAHKEVFIVETFEPKEEVTEVVPAVYGEMSERDFVVINGQNVKVPWVLDNKTDDLGEEMQLQIMLKWLQNYCEIHPKCNLKTLMKLL